MYNARQNEAMELVTMLDQTAAAIDAIVALAEQARAEQWLAHKSYPAPHKGRKGQRGCSAARDKSVNLARAEQSVSPNVPTNYKGYRIQQLPHPFNRGQLVWYGQPEGGDEFTKINAPDLDTLKAKIDERESSLRPEPPRKTEAEMRAQMEQLGWDNARIEAQLAKLRAWNAGTTKALPVAHPTPKRLTTDQINARYAKREFEIRSAETPDRFTRGRKRELEQGIINANRAARAVQSVNSPKPTPPLKIPRAIKSESN